MGLSSNRRFPREAGMTRGRVRRGAATAAVATSMLASGFVLASCGGTSESGGGGSDEPLIGFSLRFIAGNSWLQTLAQGADVEAKRLGYRVEAQDGRGDARTQVQQMRTFIAKGAKAIIIEPIDERGLAAGIEAANRAGIPVVAVNDRVAPDLAEKLACNVHDDAFKLGELVGQKVAEEVAKQHKPSETIKLYIMAILPKEPLTAQREEGFMKGYNDYFAEHPGPKTVRVPNGYGSALPDETLPVMRDKLSGNPDVDVIFNLTDTVHGAVMQPIKEAGLVSADENDSKVIMGSFDGRMPVVKSMAQKPGYPIVADALNQPASQAVLAVRAAVAAAKGEKPDCPGTPPTATLPSQILTKDNAKSFINADLAFAASDEFVSADAGK
jgi:ribose transport system substrate-binding protein